MSESAADDLDLGGMDPKAAREYVLAFVQSLKEAQARRERLAAELALWEQRASLARSHGREDLLAAAEARASSLRETLAAAQAEEQELAAKVAALKERLKTLTHGRIERSVDTEKLAAEMEMLLGEEPGVEHDLAEAEAAAELERLKKRLGGGGDSTSTGS